METQNRGMELALFLTLPAMVALIVAAEPIVRGLFQYGHFDAADTVKCSWALAGFSIGLPSYVLVKVLTPGYYARHDTQNAGPLRHPIRRGEPGRQPDADPVAKPVRLRACGAAPGHRPVFDGQRLDALFDAIEARLFRRRRAAQAPHSSPRACRDPDGGGDLGFDHLLDPWLNGRIGSATRPRGAGRRRRRRLRRRLFLDRRLRARRPEDS